MRNEDENLSAPAFNFVLPLMKLVHLQISMEMKATKFNLRAQLSISNQSDLLGRGKASGCRARVLKDNSRK